MPKFRVTMSRSYALGGDLKPMGVLQALAVRDVFSVQGRTERRTWEFDATDEGEVRSLLKQAGDHPNVRGFDLESITVIAGVATDQPAVCRLCLAVTGGRQCFEPACPGGVRACGSHECIAGQRDGVICANGECDRVNGVRPDGVATDGEGQS